MNINHLMQLAVDLHRTGNLEEAENIYREILRIQPDNFFAHGNMGNLLQEKGQLDEAIQCYQAALQLNPTDAGTYYNLGNAFRMKGLFDIAISYYGKAIELNPYYPGSYLNIGNIFRQMGQPEKAVDYYRKAVDLAPNSSGALYSLAQAYHDQNLLDEAIVSYEKAVQLDPNNSNAYYNMGNAYRDMGQLDNAIICYHKTLRLNPNMVEALNNLGNTLRDQGRLEEAFVSFHNLLQIAPDFADALGNLGNLFTDQGKLDAAESCYKHALEIQPHFSKCFSNLLLMMNYNSRCDAQAIFSEHIKFAKQFEEPLLHAISRHTKVKNPSHRLRIGYVSPDFRRHSVSFYIEPTLAYHSKEQFEVFCYSDAPQGDEITKRFQGYSDQWRSISGISDEKVAEMIREDGIDILVDLAGHTARNRLLVFARKPAPVQVSWIGYPATTGLLTMDYKIVDKHTDPPGMTDPFYTEKLIRMPESFLCYLPDRESPEVVPLPALSAGRIIFGSFNNFAKMSLEIMELWSKILAAVPGSRLILKAKSLADRPTQERVRDLFAQKGITVGRIELLAWQPSTKEHLSTYNCIDIALDTFPYHGTTTTCEALWMGVPVITLAGNAHASRVGTSLLSNVGLPELIAKTHDEYVTIAVELSKDIRRLQALREGLRDIMVQSPLLDAKTFIIHLENSYKMMWKQWCKAA